MICDPFGDFASRGYLKRNAPQADPTKSQQLERAAFHNNVGKALSMLEASSRLEYSQVKQAHKILFCDVYPWAGQDRREVAPELHMDKAGLDHLFSHIRDIELAASHALDRGGEPNTLREKPGEIIGHLTHAHPFLRGNGQVIVVLMADLCRRAAIHIDWSVLTGPDYIAALTKELEEPGRGHLDRHLKPYVRDGALETGAASQALQALARLEPTMTTQMQAGVFIPAREIDTHVSRREVETAAASDRKFNQFQSALVLAAGKVFADPGAFLDAAAHAAFDGRIGDTSLAERFGSGPEQFGVFRGKGGRFSSRDERKDHRNAAAYQYALKSQVREYIAFVHSLRQELSQERFDLARRGLHAVPQPSEDLMQALRAAKPLSEAQAAESKSLVKSMERRFGDDIGHLRSMVRLDTAVAAKHGVDPQKLQEVRPLLRKLDRGLEQLREQDLAPVKDQAHERGGPSR